MKQQAGFHGETGFSDVVLSGEALKEHALETAQQTRVLAYKRVSPDFMEIGFLRQEIEQYYKEARRNPIKTPQGAMEWLTDNYYFLAETAEELERGFDKKYFRHMPVVVADGRRVPRAYQIAADIVGHREGGIDEETIFDYIDAYQKHSPLWMQELWAMPALLRVALLKQCAAVAKECVQADALCERAQEIAASVVKNPEADIRRILFGAGREEILQPPFVEWFVKTMRETENGKQAIDVLRDYLAKRGLNMQGMIEQEYRSQTRLQFLMGNAIGALKMLAAISWNEMFEKLSVVEKVLQKDPVYEEMDQPSRNYYRQQVQKIACKLEAFEQVVAAEAVACCEGKEGREGHVGYYLLEDGKEELYRRFERKLYKMKGVLKKYLGLNFFLSCALSILPSAWAYGKGGGGWAGVGWFVLVFCLGLLPAYSIVETIVNRLITLRKKPAFIPKLELRGGIGEEERTLVVIPALVDDSAAVLRLLNKLEVYYLANREENTSFAVLGDFAAAKQQETPEDEKVFSTAAQRVGELNRKYGEIFCFFQRKRSLNQSSGKYEGYERKRGALMELNAALLYGEGEPFALACPRFPQGVRYVITIDEDTQLVRDSARKLVGAMAHPLNRPVLSEDGQSVCKGFSLMQPRVVAGVENANRSLFSRLFSGYKGIDRYAFTVSDIFQDLFGEGGFMGKGIYDLPVFYRVMQDRLPDNAVLSHDLLEGIYTRAAFVSDVEMVDSFPTGYTAWLGRQHRWVRGDWQLLPFLRRRVENRRGELMKNRIGTLGKWRIVDNLRRSLQPVAELLLVFFALFLLPGACWPYLTLVAAGIFGGALVEFFALLPAFWSSGGALRASVVLADVGLFVLRALFKLALLPSEAVKMADAILRSLWRTFVSRRNMLQWVTAAAVEKRAKGSLAGTFIALWPQVLAAALLFIGVFYGEMRAAAILLAVLWLAAPAIAYFLSRPIVEKTFLSTAQQKEILILARRTWAYFEEFQDARNHYLVPDNYQELPRKGLAGRTSPTNMGLALVCGISAMNFGFIGFEELTGRIEKQLATYAKLKMWNGHFYNWYDTSTLEPLRPAYVSSVDSGNMASYLLLCAEGLEQAEAAPILSAARIDAIEQTLCAAREDGEPIDDGFFELLLKMREEEAGPGYYALLRSAMQRPMEGGRWLRRAHGMIQSLWRDVETYMPWNAYLPLQEETRPFYTVSFRELAEGIESLMKRASDAAVAAESRSRLKADLLRARAAVWQVLRKNGEAVRALHRYFDEMDFSVLYDERRELFSIGMDLESGRLSKSHYDLLASEARMTSFIAVAKRDVPMKHWFRLGRPMTAVGKGRMLLSWSGTMFEYFMPLLAMKDYKHTLMHETYEMALLAQRQAAEESNIPFGISESAFYAFDMNLNYQYKAFGVPKCSMTDHRTKELVVSPYSTALVLPFAPHTAYRNMKRLFRLEAAGEYGFYDAVDFTQGRLPGNRKFFVVKTFMAHHQGMTLCALDNLLHGNVLQHTFHSIPLVQSAEILLQEQISRGGVTIRRKDWGRKDKGRYSDYRTERHIAFQPGKFPQVQLLSNGKYHTMLTAAGTGYSMWGDRLIGRWRSDATRDFYGIFYYVRPVGEEGYWSPAFMPARREDGEYSVRFEAGKAVFTRSAEDFTTTMEVCVSPESDVEIRRITIENHTNKDREMQITQFLETVLCGRDADIAHRAFAGLFVETGVAGDMVYARYRPGGREKEVNLFCACHVEGDAPGKMEVETERIRAIGRLRDVTAPRMMDPGAGLSGSVGAPIDPCICCRLRIMVPAGGKAAASFALAVSAKREEAEALAAEYQAKTSIERAFEMAWTRSQVELRHLQPAPGDWQLFHKIAARLLFAGRGRVSGDCRGAAALWECGVSGDLPVWLVRISDLAHIDNLQRLFKAYEFFRSNGLDVDMIVLNEYGNDYIRPLHDKIGEMAAALRLFAAAHCRGRIILLEKAWVSHLPALLRASDLVMDSRDLILEEREGETSKLKKRRTREYAPVVLEVPPLLMDNTIGGFTEDGAEYVMWLQKGKTTPLPWCNVMANPSFGAVCSESGGGYTWAQNSREYKISPWSNDQIGDAAGEGVFLRDEESGEAWTLTPGLLRQGDYLVRHGRGYTQFEYGGFGLLQKLSVHVDRESPMKIYTLSIYNPDDRPRRLTALFYCDWVLGAFKHQTWKYIDVSFDGDSTIAARRDDMPPVFISAPGRKCGALTDKAAFWGYGYGELPCGLFYEKIGCGKESGEPYGVLHTQVTVGARSSEEIVFVVSCDRQAGDKLLQAPYGQSARRSLALARENWEKICGKLRVDTPDISMNLLLRWLPYQVLSSRIFGRTGFYQAGGAYGFRDQLQDCICLLDSCPQLVRAHLLLCAVHQFLEGDVQHWWHPPANGVRTHISDDLLFLPYVAALYVRHTGDEGILYENVPFLEGPMLSEGQEDCYFSAQTSKEQGTLLEHCMRALLHVRFGEHGLPLMGGGDWNDGMNRVGHEGKGESVWLGFFFYDVLQKFLPLAARAGDGRVEQLAALLPDLERALDDAWDGAWFRRAYFDDGAPLGSARSPECSMDIISQSWAVLSGAARKEKQRQAFDSALSLVDEQAGLLKLLWPPFESWKDPGYIRGYIPGVRENGGQYTHAAVWMVAAAAKLGLGDTAFRLFGMLNPVNHGRTDKEIMTYKAEPYVVAADVYSNAQHNGRGGWTWYTGSASWMYAVAVRQILGFKKEGSRFAISPCIPADWNGFSLEYRYEDSIYKIAVENPDGVEAGVCTLYVDGEKAEWVPLESGKGEVLVRAVMGPDLKKDTEKDYTDK